MLTTVIGLIGIILWVSGMVVGIDHPKVGMWMFIVGSVIIVGLAILSLF